MQWAWAKEEIEEMIAAAILIEEIVIVVETAEAVVEALTAEAVAREDKAAEARVEEDNWQLQ